MNSSNIKVKKEHIGNIVKETYGIVYHRYCLICGKNLPWLEWECPNCEKTEVKDLVDE